MEAEVDNIVSKYCEKCTGICCKNLAVEIGRPENKSEVEALKWQLHFDTVKVYIHNKRWHMLIDGECLYLSKNNKCTIYSNRPNRCRAYNPPNCEFFGKFYNIMMGLLRNATFPDYKD